MRAVPRLRNLMPGAVPPRGTQPRPSPAPDQACGNRGGNRVNIRRLPIDPIGSGGVGDLAQAGAEFDRAQVGGVDPLAAGMALADLGGRSEEHTSELQSLM